MKSKICLLVSLIACICCVFGYHELPNFIHVCKHSEPDMYKCFKKSIDIIRPHIIKGIPELDIPQIEPITIGDLLLSERTGSNNVGLTVSATEITSYGASNFDVTNITMLEFGKKYIIDVVLPKLYVEGKYQFDGTILFLSLVGTGPFSANFTDVTGRATLELAETQKDGETHVYVKNIKISGTVGAGHINFENLFNGKSELLAQVVSETINNNFHEFSQQIKPLVEKSLAKFFGKISNKVYDRFTMEQLFPNN